MFISRIHLKNWRNFRSADVLLGERAFLIGPNACGKSNFLDIFRFMHDIVKPGGGFPKAVKDRGGVSKIRCLAAREASEVELEFFFTESLESQTKEKYRYVLAFNLETRGNRRTLITREEVWKDGGRIIKRPDDNDEKDEWRLTQTNLEQISVNLEFREITAFFNAVRYLHIVPQILRNPDIFFNTAVSGDDDSFGFHFLEKIHEASPKTRESRLHKIEQALKMAVPQLTGLTLVQDNRGVPHLQVTYEHWRPNAGKQQEDQFSDGTIRLIAFLWSLLESNSLLLLEEPELSLSPYIVNQVPGLIHRITSQKKKKQQILISTHSPDLLSDEGIGAEEIFLFRSDKEGTVISPSHNITEIQWLLKSGMKISEAALPLTRPQNMEQLNLFK